MNIHQKFLLNISKNKAFKSYLQIRWSNKLFELEAINEPSNAQVNYIRGEASGAYLKALCFIPAKGRFDLTFKAKGQVST